MLILPYIDLFGFRVATYGLLILVGAILGIVVALLRAKRYHQKKEDVLFCALFAGIGVAVGAKLLYLVTILPDLIQNWNTLMADPAYLTSIITGGFVFYGGLIGAVLMLLVYCKRYKIDTLSILDLFAPAIPLIHAIGRLGCFSAGCCYGRPAEPPWGMLFPNSVAGPQDVPLLPVQLYESVLNLLLFAGLLLLSHKVTKRGALIGCYLISYAAIRFVLEFFRYDYVRGFLFGISTSQWISILLLPLGLLLVALPKNSRLFLLMDFSTKNPSAEK
ncbi:MAG: prolipoprotein diacylglyceryl transferase [Clostridiales bacterium]|nr:prolipoprotein diacylglyceryl transferase [Clostridiales bacterium]